MTQTTDAALVPKGVRALRVQNSAFRALNCSLEKQIEYHRAKAQEYHAATTTLDSEREANRILTDTIEAQARRIEALEGALRECADDLEAEVAERYKGWGDHPAIAPKVERDMAPAEAARALLTKAPTP